MILEEIIGQTLVFGIPGTKARAEDVRLFRETNAGGLILYRINFESPAQIRRLVTDLEEALGRRLLVTVDHEGGRVIMFRDGVTIFPDNLTFGAAGRLEDAERHGEIEAKELRRLGVDVNFSPTVDVLTEGYSPNIGIRSYGRDPAVVAGMAAARIRAMQRNGVSACAKHFPGLGAASLDPHLDLPVIPSTWRDVRRTHLPPFLKAMDAGVDVIMSSHPLYPKLDPAPKTPVTFSRRLITDLLRRELKFDGVISSDDLEMGALRKICSIGRAAVLTAKAGHDLILCCHEADLQRRVYQALRDAHIDGTLDMRELERSAERIQALREKRPRRFSAGAPAADKRGAILARDVARRAVTVKGAALPELKRLDKNRRLCVVFPRLSDLAGRIMIERELENETAFLASSLNRLPARKTIELVPIDPRKEEALRAVRFARDADATVFFCYDAHIHAGCRRLLMDLQKASSKFILVLLRDPYDEVFAAPGTSVVTAYGSRACQIRACLETLSL
ncbi:MAG: beta-N-acetylhexosaminidase [Elusimicrobia bacterium]|nr:beta-N-acetylhexosaminidase [Elusimicrobiota bacterium]